MSTFAGSWRLELGMLLGLTLISADSVFAAPRPVDDSTAKNLVREALTREIYGDADDRAELLDRASSMSPDYAPAMWHRGYLRSEGEWIKADDLPATASKNRRLSAYLKIREEYSQTAGDQWKLANWCNERGLKEQERAHLSQVLTLDPENADARARLGFVRIDGAWVASEDLRASAETQNRGQANLAHWREEMQELISGLRNRSEHKRTAALKKLEAIDQLTAVPALEQMLARESEDSAALAVNLIAQFAAQDATDALARLSVNSPWDRIRQQAAEKLSTRDEMSYVPSMLASLYTPTMSRMQVFKGRSGRMIYQHVFYREGQEQGQLAMLETTYRRASTGPEAASRAVNDMQNTVMQRERNRAGQNAMTAMMNQRVCDALQVAVGQQMAPQPEAWWNWWNQHNGIFVQGQKPVQTFVGQRQVAVAGPPPTPQDCLAAGTKVWTATGYKPIEEMAVGDLVLAQDSETGELALKPVIRTTIRPISRLVRVETSEGSIESSEGHPFWVSGEGWVKARDLRSGMELHGVSGPVRIINAVQTSEEQTYNMIVADFNTYFVGEAKVLSHDNTIREATLSLVPGMPKE
ncbi:polymorphic toxin-type HINT domain-containing protein [Lignipirellula cremea]|uniref:Hint domain-containing protein n=1 Tax=Lignipirellula cremea TaxID=2528010 RepID=A0A518DSZ9_9BACT|nr:polymorphic toxin-type HINT domain-containing protein [Lignipirellula cremea]QDU94953.1 hypothetical protein Pla8534_27620 [Lignipirellula cremea]